MHRVKEHQLLDVPVDTAKSEPVAFQEYQKKLTGIHPDFTLRKAGFYVGDAPYLGVSPDGVLVDKAGKLVGIVEIKCPYSAANLIVLEACEQLSTFYCSWNMDNIQLDTKHNYYFQIQGTMEQGIVTSLSGCQSPWR